MNDVEDVTPERIEAAFAAQRTRVRHPNSIKDVFVELPSLTLMSWSGWLCMLCLRVPLRDQRPWSWFGCEYCRGIDGRVGSLLGGERFLPLGQNSIMNGMGVRLDESSPLRVRAAHDRLTAMGQEVPVIGRWRDQLAGSMAQQWLDEHGSDDPSVSISAWRERYPAGPLHSAITYASLLDQHYPWIFDVTPQARDLLRDA